MDLKEFREGDQSEITRLFSAAFKKEMSLAYWDWRFSQNPFSEKKYISTYWDGEQLIGHYAASPIEFLKNGDVIKSAISMTTMVDPNYQRLGVFPIIANDVNKKLEKDGFELIWGFPNNNSHFGLVNGIGWNDVALMPMLSLQKNQFPIDSKFNNFDFTLLHDFYETKDDIFVVPSKSIQINKTKKYLNWRYVLNPLNDYKIIAIDDQIIVYKTLKAFHDPDSLEVDILEISARITFRQIKAGISWIIKNEINIYKINIWCSIFDHRYKFFERLGFTNGLPLTNFSVRNFKNDNSFFDFRNWDLSLGYSDVF